MHDTNYKLFQYIVVYTHCLTCAGLLAVKYVEEFAFSHAGVSRVMRAAIAQARVL